MNLPDEINQPCSHFLPISMRIAEDTMMSLVILEQNNVEVMFRNINTGIVDEHGLIQSFNESIVATIV